jgi:hypothetical protein
MGIKTNFDSNRASYAERILAENKHLDWVKRLYNKNPDTIQVEGEKFPSTHLMSDNGDGYVFPRVQRINGKLVDLGDKAEDYARESNTGIQLPKREGTWFARNGYKTAKGVLDGALEEDERHRLLTGPIINIQPITAEDRDKWEAMQSAAHQQGYFGDDHDREAGIKFMQEQGIDPDKLASYQQDFLDRKGKDTAGFSTVRAGEDGFSPVDDFYGHKTARQRYLRISTEHIDRHGNIIPADTKEYGTNVEQFTADAEKRRAEQLAEFSGMDDPKNNINYKPPVEEVVAKPAPTPDPNFPTRDPITGRVTPALNKRLRDAASVEQALNDQHADEDKEDRRRSVTRRLLNGIFGNDSEGNPEAHVN